MLNTSILIRLLVLCLLEACRGQFDDFDFGIPPARAAIEPVDSLVFVGETLKLQCLLTDSTVPVSPEDMYFEMTSHGQNLTWIVPKENVTVVNEGIFAYVKITDDYSNFTTVCCWSKNVTEPLASVYIHAEKPIKNITNMSAVYYYNRDLELTWSLGEKYLCDDCISVTVDYSASVPPNKGGYSCEEMTKESCQFRVHGQDIIFVRIAVEYDLRNLRPSSEFLEPLYDRKATSVIQINVTDHMKTQPPGNLRDRDINSTCAELTWDRPLYFSSCECEALYLVTITEKHNQSNTWTDSGVRPEGQDYITVCSLSPFTTYKLSVQIKASEINPWSEPAFTEVTTNEARPLTGPPLTPTSYHVYDCVDNQAEVTVYWNDQLKSLLQGELTRFEVVVDNVTTLLRRGSNYYKTKLDCDVDHDVQVYSATMVGPSLSPSNISIPRSGAELSAINDVMVRMEEAQASSASDMSLNVTVTWDPGLHVERNVTFVFYMCQGASFPFTCFNDFSTKETSVAKTEMRLQDLEASVSLFGYALIDDQGHKRGIQWINCVYRAEEFPRKPDPVNVNVGRSPNTLEISWPSRRCDRETKVLILRYHLLICRQKITQQRHLQFCSNTTVNSSKSNYIAEDLTGGSTYYAYIQAESPAGLGPLSQPTPGVPTVANSNPEHLLGIVMGTLLLMIFASIIVIILVRQCMRSRKKIGSLAENKYNIFENEKQIQHQVISGSKTGTVTNWTPTLETPLDRPLVPPALESKRTANLTQQILSVPTPAVGTGDNVVDDTNKDHPKDKILSIATDMDTSEHQLIRLQDVPEASEMPDLPENEHGCLHSDSANPYVKMTNECFSSGSENQTVAVDEGYNSPEADINSPVFSLGTPQTQWTGVSSISPLGMNGIVPILSPQSQNVFTCTGFSQFPSQSKKVLPDLPLMSPQTEISKTDLSVNSPKSQISETNLSNIVSSVILHPNSQQSLNSLIEASVSPKLTFPTNSSIIPVYHVSSHSAHPVQSLPPHTELPHPVNFQDSIMSTTTTLDSNPLAVTNMDSNPPSVSHLCSKHNPELNVYYIHGTSLPVRPQIEFCQKNKATPAARTEASDFTENGNDLSKGDNSHQQILSGYVTCAIDGVVNFRALGADTEHESTDSETMFSHYKPDCQTSQNLATPDGSQNSSGGYKSLEFLENSPELDLGSQGSIGTLREDSVDQGRIGTLREDSVDQGRIGTLREDSVNQGRFGTHTTNYVGKRRFVDQLVSSKENFGDQNRLPDCISENVSDDKDGIDTYVTCAINGEVNFEKVCFHPQYELVDSLNRCPYGTPSCLTKIPSKDVFSDNKLDYSQIICGQVAQRSMTEADKDDSQGSCGEYKGLSFLEHFPDSNETFGSQKEDCIRQAGCGVRREDCIEMHNMNFPKEVCLPIENSDSVCVRPDCTHKDLNVVEEKFTLKPVHVGNNVTGLSKVLPEPTITGDSSFERDDLDNTSADATIDNCISEGGYVSHVQLCALAQLNVSHC